MEFESREMGSFLLDIGISMLKAGASCTRTRSIMLRCTRKYNYETHIIIGAKSVSLSLNGENGHTLYNGTHTVASHGINFSAISSISDISRKVAEKRLSIPDARNELESVQKWKHYPQVSVLCLVGLACAGFCFTFGGGIKEMSITFSAAFCGLFIKQQLNKINLNGFACTYVAAVTASGFVAAVNLTGILETPLHAFSASVLFLVPGVLLINCFTDILDGYTMNGIERGVIALSHILAIAFGLSTTILVFHPGT